MQFKTKELIHELKHHLPFTAFASLVGVIIILIINYFIKTNISESLFEILHPLHVLISAFATSAMFYKYQKTKISAILVGILGAIIIGSLSDVVLPYLGGLIFQLQPTFHLPIIQEPITILVSALIGGIIGISIKQTRAPHSLHVFLSVFASLTYLLAFSQSTNLFFFILALIIVIIAVIIPCCVSDIIFPFFFLREKIKSCDCEHC
jgi:hypothetical protein